LRHGARPFLLAASVVNVLGGAIKALGRCAVGEHRALTAHTTTDEPAHIEKGSAAGATTSSRSAKWI